MRLTGNNLLRCYASLGCQLAEVQNMIATCPDPVENDDALQAYRDELDEILKLKGMIFKRLTSDQLLQLIAHEQLPTEKS